MLNNRPQEKLKWRSSLPGEGTQHKLGVHTGWSRQSAEKEKHPGNVPLLGSVRRVLRGSQARVELANSNYRSGGFAKQTARRGWEAGDSGSQGLLEKSGQKRVFARDCAGCDPKRVLARGAAGRVSV